MMTTLWIHSCSVAVGAWVVALLAGLAASLVVATTGPVLRRLGLLAGAVTLALPPFLPANCWLELTANWRTAIGAERASVAMLPLTALVLGLGLWPITLFLVLGAWRKIQPSLLEAEPNLRGGILIRCLLWPACRSALALSSVLILTLALANFTVPTLFQVRVFTEEFWLRYNTQFDLWGALYATWPLWILPMGLGWALRGREVVWIRESAGLSPSLLARRLGHGWRTSSGFVAGLVILATLGLPLVQLVINQRTWSELAGAVAAGRLAIINSFLSAAVVAVIVAGAGLVLASREAALHRSVAGGLVRWLGRAAWMMFLLPGVFLSVVMITVLNRPGLFWLYSSFGIVWLALGLRYLAPAWSGARAAHRSVDPTLEEMALMMGARGRAHFRLVTWPQLGGSVMALAYSVYLLCLWDVETIVLIQPPGGETVALRIFNLLHYGHAAQVNALCLVILGLAVVPLLGYGFLRWVGGRRRSNRAGSESTAAGLMVRRITVPWGLVAGLAPGLLSGCSDSIGADPGSKALDSKLFASVQTIGSRGVAPGQFNKPRSLTCDLNDNLYVADITGRIQKFSPDGRFLMQWQMPQTDLGKAKGMSTDRAGNIIVVEPHYQRVNHFNSDGQLIAQWGHRGTNSGEFILPRCIAVNSAGEFYLGEYTIVERVQRFSVEADLARKPRSGISVAVPFTLMGQWGRPGQEPREFNRAEGIAVGPGDLVYVADSCNHRIQVFDRSGQFVRSHGQAGTAPGAFSFPYDVRVDASGRQFVCEFGNSRLSIFDATDQLVETIGRAGREPGEFANPWAICFDSKGNLYVADSQNHRVQKLLRRRGALSGDVIREASNLTLNQSLIAGKGAITSSK